MADYLNIHVILLHLVRSTEFKEHGPISDFCIKQSGQIQQVVKFNKWSNLAPDLLENEVFKMRSVKCI